MLVYVYNRIYTKKSVLRGHLEKNLYKNLSFFMFKFKIALIKLKYFCNTGCLDERIYIQFSVL